MRLDKIDILALTVATLAVLLVVGCDSYGRIKHRITRISPSGEQYQEESEVRTPNDPTSPATMEHGGSTTQPGFIASTGAGQKISQAVKQMGVLIWIGAGLMIAGVVLLAGKTYWPVIPMETGPLIFMTGLGLLFVPGLWEEYKVWIALGAAGCVIAAITTIVLRLNKREAEEAKKTTKRSEL